MEFWFLTSSMKLFTETETSMNLKLNIVWYIDEYYSTVTFLNERKYSHIFGNYTVDINIINKILQNNNWFCSAKQTK